MDVLPPDELMIDTFLPSIRHLIAKELRSQGYSQSAISAMLGVTQASVSMYLGSDGRKAITSLSRLSVTQEEALRYAKLLSEDLKRGPLDAQTTLDSIWKGLIGRGDACREHRSRYRSLSDCDMCMKQYGSVAASRPEAVSAVQEAVDILQSSSVFAAAMPEVSVNVAYAPTDSESSDDVVAVPGRIVRVKDRAHAMSRAEFGASRHLALLLLMVRRRSPSVRACINLRYDSKMASTLKRLRLKPLIIGGYATGGGSDPTVEALAERLLGNPGKFDSVVDTGTKGIEPNLYLFAATPGEAAELAVKVAENYSAH